MPHPGQGNPYADGGLTAGKKNNATSALPKKADKGAVSALVSKLFSESRNLRRREEGNWYIDARYLAGDQWVIWDPKRLSLSVRAKKHWRIRQTINHLRPAIEVLINVLTQRQPRLNVVPASPDPEDRHAARACEHMLAYLWREQGIEDTLDEALTWMAVTSRGIMKVSWDMEAGPTVELPDFSQVPPGAEIDPELLPTVSMKIGEITTQAIPTFNFHIDPAATSLKKARWCGDESYMHVEEARLRWPKLATTISPDGGQDVWYNYARKLMYEGGARKTSEDISDTVTIREIYFRPDRKYPNGRKITLAGGAVVEDMESPFPDGEFPYVDFLAYRNPGSYWGQSIVNLGRNAQTSFNRARSHFMELMNKTGNPQWMVAKGAGVTRTALTDEPGSVIYYNPIGITPVTQLPGTQPPPGWNQLMNMDLQDMRDQLGIMDVLRGENPAGVRAGRSIAYLIEQNLGRHGPMIKRFERSIQSLGQLWLKMAQKFYEEDRTFSILGSEGRIEVLRLKTADLKSSKDVIVATGSLLPESRAARQDFVLELYRNGLIMDEAGLPDTKRALRLMEYTSEPEIYEADTHDRNWALEENERMGAGQQVMPEAHDNHPLHAEIHVAFMRTSRFRGLPPQLKALYRQHLDMHIQILQGSMGLERGPGDPEEGTEPAAEDMRGGGGGGAPEPRTDLRGGPE